MTSSKTHVEFHVTVAREFNRLVDGHLKKFLHLYRLLRGDVIFTPQNSNGVNGVSLLLSSCNSFREEKQKKLYQKLTEL